MAEKEEVTFSLEWKVSLSLLSHPWNPIHSRQHSTLNSEHRVALALPMMCTLSFGAGCCGNHWHVPSRSSPDRAGNCDTVGIGSEIPSYSHCGSRSTPLDGRLRKKVHEDKRRKQNYELEYGQTQPLRSAFFCWEPWRQVIVDFYSEKHLFLASTYMVKHMWLGVRYKKSNRMKVRCPKWYQSLWWHWLCCYLILHKNFNDLFPKLLSVSRRLALFSESLRSTKHEHSWTFSRGGEGNC